jgi:hypothetical protein
MPGTFCSNELIVIEFVTLVGTVDWYVQFTATGLALFVDMLFIAVLALSGVASVLLLLRWAYLGAGDSTV